MFKFLKNLSGKTKKIMLSVGTGVVAASAMAIAACAEGAEGAGGSATTLDISTIVNSAGSTLQTQFVALVQYLLLSALLLLVLECMQLFSFLSSARSFSALPQTNLYHK